MTYEYMGMHCGRASASWTMSNWLRLQRGPIRIRNRARFAHLNLYRNLI